MARTSRGGGFRGKRVSLPSVTEMFNIVGRDLGTYGSEFSGPKTSISKVRVDKTEDIFRDNTNFNDFYNPTEYENLAGEVASLVEYVDPTCETKSDRPFYEVVKVTGDLRIPGFQPDEYEDASPAPLTLVPTSTTNPKRPRTVAAGYDREQQKLTVMFRDGTLYNYYEVTSTEWTAFKSNRSKGAVIYRMLDFKPRGYADDSSMSQQAREAFYRFSRGSQIYSKGKEKGQETAKFKTVKQSGKNTKKRR